LRLFALLPLALLLVGCAPKIDMERVACDTAGTAAYATLADDAAPSPTPDPDIPPPPNGSGTGKVGDVSPARLVVTPAGLRHEIERPVDEPAEIEPVAVEPVESVRAESAPAGPPGPQVPPVIAAKKKVPQPLPPRAPVYRPRVQPAPAPLLPRVFRRWR
jgi:hypothetical protein